MANQAPLVVIFNVVDSFLGATHRMLQFMAEGLLEVEKDCLAHNIDFVLLRGTPGSSILEFAKKTKPSLVVCDFSPLRIAKQWYEQVGKGLEGLGVPLHQVDAHNVVPAWLLPKQETAARTIRPKLWDLSKEFLHDFAPLAKHPHGKAASEPSLRDANSVLEPMKFDRSVAPVSWITPGHAAAMKRLTAFVGSGLNKFGADRNMPHAQALSDLSPWLHFGHLSPQRCILAAIAAKKGKSSLTESADSFIEEIFIRRELADNFCLYNENYDNMKGAADWAKDTLELHAKDKREYVYSEQELELGKTHDKLWNAAQLEMVRRGKMHGYMRMYWCKKILEWTVSPQEAIRIAIHLNDKYELDGRDPNGYVGCMWSICGTHDMGFAERAVFGKIRWMAYDGCVRKMKKDGIEKYIKYVNGLKQ